MKSNQQKPQNFKKLPQFQLLKLEQLDSVSGGTHCPLNLPPGEPLPPPGGQPL